MKFFSQNISVPSNKASHLVFSTHFQLNLQFSVSLNSGIQNKPLPKPKQVRKTTRSKESNWILCYYSIFYSCKFNDTFEHSKCVFHYSPDAGFAPILPFLRLCQLTLACTFATRKVCRFWCSALDGFLSARVGRVTVNPCLGAAQQPEENLAVMNVGRNDQNRVYQFGLTLYPNVSLPSKVPLISLLNWFHLCVTGVNFILGIKMSANVCCIDDPARGDFHVLV